MKYDVNLPHIIESQSNRSNCAAEMAVGLVAAEDPDCKKPYPLI
jgi:hypothetical protein